jgi:hypothetical protein
VANAYQCDRPICGAFVVGEPIIGVKLAEVDGAKKREREYHLCHDCLTDLHLWVDEAATLEMEGEGYSVR